MACIKGCEGERGVGEGDATIISLGKTFSRILWQKSKIFMSTNLGLEANVFINMPQNATFDP